MLMNPLDVFMQRNYVYARYRKWWIERAVSRYFKAFVGDLTGKRILEVGCGSGYGAQVIKQFFDPDEVTATDLDPRLISKARSRVVDPSISFDVADASRLPYSDEQFDAIFDFAAIHHIPEWKECLRELRRVVRTGGRIFMIDCPIESFGSFLGRLARIYTSHPYGEMFSEAEFINLLSQLDFKVCFCGTCFARTCTTSSWWWRSDYLAILGHHLQLKPAVSMIYNANCAAPMNPGRRIEGNRG